MSDFSQNLWQQTKRGNWDPLKQALETQNAELDVDFSYGPLNESFLHIVAANGNVEMCKMLMDKGCNLNSLNRQGVTALYLACAVNAPEVVELLMKSGADPNTLIPAEKLENGGAGNSTKEWLDNCRVAPSPLHVASLKGSADVIEVLLGFGELDANVQNSAGDSALHLACANGHLSAARLLVKRIQPTVANATGQSALDLAKGEEMKAALSSSGAGSGAAAMLATGGVTAGSPKTAPKEDPAVVLARCGSEVPEIFGRDLALQLYSDQWKSRAAGLDTLTAMVSAPSGAFAGRQVTDETFEAACAVLTDLIHDKHQKVYKSVLKTLHEFFSGPVAKALPISKEDLHPAVELIYIALLKKMESAQARQAADATQAILDMVTTADCLAVSALVELVYAYDTSPRPARAREDGEEGTPATTPSRGAANNNWRPLHARLRILGELVKMLGDRAGTGLTLDRTLDVALPCLENASVQVRKSALEITAACLEAHAKAQAAKGESAGGAASLEEAVLEIKEEYLGPPLKTAVMKQVMSKLCKSLKVKISKRASSAKSKKGGSSKKKKSKSKSSKGAGDDAMAEADGDDGNHEFDVQDLSAEDAKKLADVTAEYGDTVAQYIASSNWQARKRGIKMLVDILRDGKTSKESFRENPRRLKAAIDILHRSLVDTVQHIYVSGLKLVRFLGELAQKESRGPHAASPNTVDTFFEALTTQVSVDLLPVIIGKFANTKERVRKQTKDTLISLSRLGAASVSSPSNKKGGRAKGLETVVSSLLSEIEGSSDKDSTYLVTGRLETLCELLNEHNVPVAPKGQSSKPDGRFMVAIPTILNMGSAALLTRDAASRATADTLFEYLCKQVGRDVLEELPNLTENGRIRLKACLAKVEMLENFAAVSLQQPNPNAAGGNGAPPRPGASSGRPPASGGRPGASSGRPDRSSLNRTPSPSGGQNLNSRRARLQSAAGPRACDLITKLPQADPVPAKMKKIAAPMFTCFGDALTRCLLATDWNMRNTGIIVLRTRMLQACGMVPQEQITEKDTIPAGSTAVVRLSMDVIARACEDRIAKVYESALDLLQVLSTNYVGNMQKEKGGNSAKTTDDQLVLIFRPAVVGILPKLNHRNERLRAKSEQLLMHLCRIPFLGPRCISSLVSDVEAFKSHRFTGPTLVGIFSLVRLVIEEFGIGDSSGFDPDQLMAVLVPALENKHLDVRKAATELYAVLYLAVGDNAHATLNDLISGLKPQVKAKCTSAVNLLKSRSGGGNSPAASPANSSRPRTGSGNGSTFGSADDNEKQKHQGLMRERMAEEREKIAPVFGEEASKRLCDPDSWEIRAAALSDLSNALLDGEALKPGFDNKDEAWTAVCNVMKQGLMSPWPMENLGALELIGTVVDAIPGMEIEIPWTSWEARLVLGSIVKSLVEKSSSPHVRVKEVAALTLSRVSDAHSVGLSLAARYLLTEVKIPACEADTANHTTRLRYARYGHSLMAKLKLLREIVRNDCFSAGCSNLTLEAVLTFALRAWEHASNLVQMWAKSVCAVALNAAGATVAAEYVSGLPAMEQVKLRTLLPELSESQLDEQRRAAQAGNGSLADGDGAVAAGTVRGPTFSPIDTEAGSKSRSRTRSRLSPDQELSVNFGTVSSPSFSANNLPPSGRIRPRRKSGFRGSGAGASDGTRAGLSSAPASDGYAPVDFSGVGEEHDASNKPSSAPWLGGRGGGRGSGGSNGGGGGGSALQEEARNIAARAMRKGNEKDKLSQTAPAGMTDDLFDMLNSTGGGKKSKKGSRRNKGGW